VLFGESNRNHPDASNADNALQYWLIPEAVIVAGDSRYRGMNELSDDVACEQFAPIINMANILTI